MGSPSHQRATLLLAGPAGRLGEPLISIRSLVVENEDPTFHVTLYGFLGRSDPKLCPLEDGGCCSVSIVGGDVCVLQEDPLNLSAELRSVNKLGSALPLLCSQVSIMTPRSQIFSVSSTFLLFFIL